MGLFSSSYVTTVGTSVSRVIKNEDIIPSYKTGLINALFGPTEGQLVENILESVTAGMGIRAERAYDYAKSKYTFGLPTGKVAVSTAGKEAAMALIRTQIPDAVCDYYHIGPVNNLHVGWVHLTSLEYLSTTNEIVALSRAKGYPVFLKDMVVVIKDTVLAERTIGELEQWGFAANLGFTPERTEATEAMKAVTPPTPFKVDIEAPVSDAVHITYIWAVPETVVITPATATVPAVTITRNKLFEETLKLPITTYDRTKDYYQIRFITEERAIYTIYQFGSGKYPTLDKLFDPTTITLGEFFPFIYFRHKFKSMGTNKQDPAYKTADTIMKKLGMDYATVIDQIHESPDIAKVEQALMMFAVPAMAPVGSTALKNPMEQRYLFEFFDKLYKASGGDAVSAGTWDIGDVGSGDNNLTDGARPLTAEEAAFRKLSVLREEAKIRISIQDGAPNQEPHLKTALSCMNIFKTLKIGQVRPDALSGDYDSDYTTEALSYKYTKREATGISLSLTDGGGGIVYEDKPYTGTYNIDLHIYKRQVSLHVYEEIKVYDLKMTYYMQEGYFSLADDLQDFLLVPLDHAITQHYSTSEREILYNRSLHFVFNAKQVTEVAWYQSGVFQAIITAVGFILTAWSLGSDGGFFATAAATLVEAGVLGLVMVTAMELITNILIMEGLKLFVNAVGVDIAFLAAIVAVAYGGYQAFQAGSIKGAPWAQDLLALGNGLTTAIGKNMLAAMQGLQNEMEQYGLLAKERTNLLDEANKLLENNNILNPMIIFGETPDDFYNRTVHSGNIGMVGIDSITSYVDIALTLPKINDTLGSNNYG